MKKIEEKILQRLADLITKGQQAKGRYIESPPNVLGGGHIEYTIFHEWKNSSENLLIQVTGNESNYTKNFIEKTKNAWISAVDSGIGILQALKSDIEAGFVKDIKELIVAEVFTDFLDMAEHLLNNGYKDPAAFLVGATLEDGLRKIATIHGIAVRISDDIGGLNMKLADKEVYNRLMQKQVQAWKAIRDHADHGKFDQYKKEDVEDMLKGVQRFLGENL